ncbi:MAG: GNAT family N-acetyltransferase, partial [Acidimicrobiia bacterium]
EAMTPVPFMTVSARPAEPQDIRDLERLYAGLASEQRAIRPIWPYTDGVPEPIGRSLSTLLERPDGIVVLGHIDHVPLGFLVGVEQPLLAPMAHRTIGVIQLIFTDHEARGVGVGAAMLHAAMEEFRKRGIDLFDAQVSPGHRMAKNFFESNGFKARSITMYRGESEIAPAPIEPLI